MNGSLFREEVAEQPICHTGGTGTERSLIIDQNRPLAEVVQEVLNYAATLGLQPT
jgi:hypothetical protein